MSFRSSENNAAVKGVVIGMLITCAVTALLTVLTAVILGYVNGIPYGALEYIMTAISGVAVFIGAYIASAIAKSRGLIIGAICAGLSFIILLIIGMSMGDGNLSVLTAIKAAVMLLAGMLGGIRGVNRKEKIHIK